MIKVLFTSKKFDVSFMHMRTKYVINHDGYFSLINPRCPFDTELLLNTYTIYGKSWDRVVQAQKASNI